MDELRIRIYQRPLRPYTSAVRKAGGNRAALAESHEIRLRCATEHLPERPLTQYGLARMMREVCETVGVTGGSDVVEWMPDAAGNFHGLEP